MIPSASAFDILSWAGIPKASLREMQRRPQILQKKDPKCWKVKNLIFLERFRTDIVEIDKS